MIDRYTNHAANERTYLAWVRASISVMIFGFLIEKFDLILSHTVKNINTGEMYQSSIAVELLGLVVFSTGVLVTIISTIRFFKYRKYIMSDDYILYKSNNTALLLSLVIVLIAIFLLFYMVYEFEIDLRLGLI